MRAVATAAHRALDSAIACGGGVNAGSAYLCASAGRATVADPSRQVNSEAQITRARRVTRVHARSLVRTVASSASAVANTSASGRRRAVWRARSLAAPSAVVAVNGWTWIPRSATSCLTTETASGPRREGSTRTSAYALAGRTSASRRACPMAATAAAWCASLASSSAMTTLASRTTIATLDGVSAAFPSHRPRSAGPRSWPRPPRRG